MHNHTNYMLFTYMTAQDEWKSNEYRANMVTLKYYMTTYM